MKTTMRVKIGTPLYKRIVQSVKDGGEWSFYGKPYKITDARRIERTDYVSVEITEVDVKWP